MRRKKANCKLFLNQEINHQLQTVIYELTMPNIVNHPTDRSEDLRNMKHCNVMTIS